MMFKLKYILEDTNYYKFFKTRLVATIGPSSRSKEKLVKLLDEGMTIARVNLFHGTTKSNIHFIKDITEAFKERKSQTCAIMVDTRGRGLKLLEFEEENNNSITF